MVAELAESDRSHAAQLAQYAALTLRMSAKVFLQHEED
jgi:hypothetical protein